MEFIGYSTLSIFQNEDIVHKYRNNFVFRETDEGNIILAIPTTSFKDTIDYALFRWNDAPLNDIKLLQEIIYRKEIETKRFFQESVGIWNSPHLHLYKDAQMLLKINGVTDNNENGSSIYNFTEYFKIQKDQLSDVWHLNIGNIISFKLANENSAIRLSQIIKKDIEDYIRYRWSN